MKMDAIGEFLKPRIPHSGLKDIARIYVASGG